MFVVYALYNSKHQKIYIGQTNNLQRRLEEHNQKIFPGRKYTAAVDGTWDVVYEETLETRREAIIREKQIKSFKGREFIKNLISRKYSSLKKINGKDMNVPP